MVVGCGWASGGERLPGEKAIAYAANVRGLGESTV